MSEQIGVYVTTEQRLLAYKGEIFAEAVGGNDFWLRYLDSFDWLKIVARCQQVEELPKFAIPINDHRIQFALLPNYYGPGQLLRSLTNLWAQTKQISNDKAAYILRVPGMLGTFLYRHLCARDWPYAVEVVGDPNDSLSLQAIGKSWARIIRPLAVREMRKQCRDATAAAYVTAQTLQSGYPSQANFVTHYSSIELPQELIDPVQNDHELGLNGAISKSINIPQLIFVGSLSQRYKGLHVLLNALKIDRDKNLNFHLHILGDGSHRQEYEQLTSQLGLDKSVTFHGFVKQGHEVFQHLRQADLFLMPSLMEGLPRAMIEAMACGLPCIGSRIGGIPELLEAQDIVPPGDAPALADAIFSMVNDHKRMRRTGTRNREVALQYRSQVLRPRRQEMYDYLRDITTQKIMSEESESKRIWTA